MVDDIKGTWEEVIQRNEQELRDFEARVLASRYKELHLWKDGQLFSIRKGNGLDSGQWDIWTPEKTYFGKSADEVLQQAAQPYPEIYSWMAEFNDR